MGVGTAPRPAAAVVRRSLYCCLSTRRPATRRRIGRTSSIAAALVLGLAIGLLQGALFSSFGVPSFIITLAGLLAWQGLQLVCPR
jgi:ABC-type xylose transport system permease subunit